MRHSMIFATALLTLAAFGGAGAQSQTVAPPAQQSQQEQLQSPQQKQDSLPGSAEHQRQVDDALNSESGRAGKAEPLPQAKSDDSVLVNGMWNVPGAPQDSQTVPSKYSARNAALDKLPIMAAPIWLTDEQRRKVAAMLLTGSAPTDTIDTTFAQELPCNVEMLELPETLKREIPDVKKLKYVRAGDRILLVDPQPPNRTVVGEIKN
jgi:hypothetical protein